MVCRVLRNDWEETKRWAGLDADGGVDGFMAGQDSGRHGLDVLLEVGYVVISTEPSTVTSHTRLRFETWPLCHCEGRTEYGLLSTATPTSRTTSGQYPSVEGNIRASHREWRLSP